MAATIVNLKINQGSYESWVISIKNKQTGAPINISNFTFSGKIRQTATDIKTLASFSFSILDAINGSLRIILDDSVTNLLPVLPQTKAQKVETDFCYDIEYTESSNTICFMQGVISVYPRVTR